MNVARRQQGAALIAVMLLIVVVLAVLTRVFFRQGVAVERATRTLHGEQATLLALSGEAWALEQLRKDASKGDTDNLAEDWALPLPAMPVEGGSLSGQLEDLQARINVNRFTGWNTEKYLRLQPPELRSDLSLFRQLGQVLSVPLSEDQLAALVDWQDPDDEPLPGGAEENEYLLKSPAYRPANGALVDIDELYTLAGFTPALVAGLKPYLVALPADAATINVNTASVTVLMALHPSIGRTEAEALVALREEAPWTSVDAFYDSLASILGLVDGSEAQILVDGESFSPVGVASHYFLLTVNVSLGAANVQMQSLIHRQSASAIGVIARSLRYLPDIAGAEAASGKESNSGLKNTINKAAER